MNWKALLGITKTVAEDAGKLGLLAAPGIANSLAPGSGEIITGLIQGITAAHSANGAPPNTELLKTSVGQIISGFIGVLEATGKIKVAPDPTAVVK